jgi:hypothetical protein
MPSNAANIKGQIDQRRTAPKRYIPTREGRRRSEIAIQSTTDLRTDIGTA